MKRYSEAVLNGHPDKFCDLLADRIIRHAYKTDPEAYAQVEIAVWSDQLFLNGSVVTRNKLDVDLREIVIQLGNEIGYTVENHIDVRKYKIIDKICWLTEDPRKWTHFVNDQSIVTGYAGYDAKTNYLPPEHYAVWYFREQVIREILEGQLKGHGPDGKVLVIMTENGSEWYIKTLLLTLQQKENFSFTEFIINCNQVLQDAFNLLQMSDRRWAGNSSDIKILVNPNGPLLNGGSDGDNGQTGRKLVMDFYGPRIQIGGGAIYGKDLSHIDRIGSIFARKFALGLVSQGSKEAFVSICYAPGINIPLDVTLHSNVKTTINPYQFFDFKNMLKLIQCDYLDYDLIRLGTFYNNNLMFNRK
ncbi:methionine adenosyltransferase [soil metagenome]